MEKQKKITYEYFDEVASYKSIEIPEIFKINSFGKVIKGKDYSAFKQELNSN